MSILVNFANRTSADSDKMVGWFVNTHLVGLNIEDCATVGDFCCAIRSEAVRAMTYQNIPTAHLWNQLGSTPRFRGIPMVFNGRPDIGRPLTIEQWTRFDDLSSNPLPRPPAQVTHYVSEASLFVQTTNTYSGLELSFNCRGG